MGLHEVFNAINQFAQEYGPTIALVSCISGISGIGFKFGWWRSLGRKILEYWHKDRDEAAKRIEAQQQSIAELNEKLSAARSAFNDDQDLWRRLPINQPRIYETLKDSIPILLVANLKGGVGKTTIAANLTSYFETEKHERVLAIDLDYQGSLSSMLLPNGVTRPASARFALQSIFASEPKRFSELCGTTKVRDSLLDSRLIECDESFANFENRAIVDWLIRDRTDDIRFRLAEVLLSPEIQNYFNRIIIDAPPRMTTGLVNALCASTDLVVPFVLDRLSAPRVGLFLNNVRALQRRLSLHVRLAAVVGTMKADMTANLKESERAALELAKSRVAQNWDVPGEFVLEKIFIPRKQAIAEKAGTGIDESARRVFDPLGDYLFSHTQRQKSTGRVPTVESSSIAEDRYEVRGTSSAPA